MPIQKPSLSHTVPHREATDTAIAWRDRSPLSAQPPNNVPLFPGQVVAVQAGTSTCKLYVGSEDGSRWFEVV